MAARPLVSGPDDKLEEVWRDAITRKRIHDGLVKTRCLFLDALERFVLLNDAPGLSCWRQRLSIAEEFAQAIDLPPKVLDLLPPFLLVDYKLQFKKLPLETTTHPRCLMFHIREFILLLLPVSCGSETWLGQAVTHDAVKGAQPLGDAREIVVNLPH